MAGISVSEANRLLDLSVTNTEIRLYTTDPDPNDDGTITGTEVAGASYSPVTPTWASASGGSVSPSADVDFGTAGEDWGTITHAAVVAKTGETDAGKSRWSGPLTTA